MQSDRFTKFLLAVIALSLVALVGEGWRRQPVVLAADGTAAKQVWEYKVIERSFRWKDNYVTGVDKWYEDGRALPAPGEDGWGALRTKLAELGAQGWELVSVTPYSDGMRMTLNTNKSPLGLTLPVSEASSLSGFSAGGMTTNDQWVFKRIKP
ncbi:DUF4177 domain-containing protein [Acidicapsa dinghuensis]|uniref:DUF4177 domain-containing protein n=1 Tax=Acidicapsa dinghuensis TaxID=2218256 RepID=A0ABW1E9M6_9BACT|nr:DUF4177 domain-containing protein [Acidicapsa dinghuensis]